MLRRPHFCPCGHAACRHLHFGILLWHFFPLVLKFKFKMSKGNSEKLNSLKKQLQDILKTIDEPDEGCIQRQDGGSGTCSSTFNTQQRQSSGECSQSTSRSSDPSSTSSSNNSFASRAVNNFR